MKLSESGDTVDASGFLSGKFTGDSPLVSDETVDDDAFTFTSIFDGLSTEVEVMDMVL
ncbi:MAG: hypothetical protein IJW33_05020 [Lentisphaeria bacterium]|nr:hypothetical protein [Lentisphaeria bacterium]